MEILKVLNALSNALIIFGGTCFYILLFSRVGHGHKSVESFPPSQVMAIKIGLAFIICGSAFNFLLLTVPPFSEILLNAGFGLIFLWAAFWHANKFGVIKTKSYTQTFEIPK